MVPYETLTLVADQTLRQPWYPTYWTARGGATYSWHDPKTANWHIVNNGSTQTPDDPIVFGKLDPGARHTLYLCSTSLSPSGVLGPSPRQSDVIAKLNVSSPVGEPVFQSMLNHRWVRCSPTTITRLAFEVRDARGSIVDMNSSRLSFVLTFSSEED